MAPQRKGTGIHAAQGTYRLDEAAGAYLNAALLHVIVRSHDVIGRFGHYGFLVGNLDGSILQAEITDAHRRGSLTATFSDGYDSFRGTLTMLHDATGPRRVSGERVMRRGKH
jgi:hypothetical protein